MPRERIRCHAVFLDAGGVLVLPARGLVRDALARAGIEIDADAVPRAHYRAVRTLAGGGYFEPFCEALGIRGEQRAAAVASLELLADRRRSSHILWSEPLPGAIATLERLRARGIPVVVVTNSDGHGAENLRDSGIPVKHVVDSAVVGSSKPDRKIFEIALEIARAEPQDVIHVGDLIAADVVGARGAGITPIHLDPYRACRAADHRHVRSLAGLWHHIATA